MTRFVIILFAVLLFAGEALAQGEARTSVRIEAEIITGLDAPGGGPAVPAPGGVTPPGGGVTPPGGGVTPPAGTVPAGQAAGTTDGQQTQSRTAPAPTADQVASSLIQSGNLGTITMADTAMVAALGAGKQSNQQNLNALITFTVVDAFGNVTNKSMQAVNMPGDVLGQTVALPVLSTTELPTTNLLATRSGDNLRRNTGITYFYVQVCSCGL